MKNIIKWTGIVLGGLVALLIIASLLLYFFLPLNAIKDFATAKLSEQLHREVKIKSVSFNLFSGIKLKGLTVSNRKGYDERPFVSADAIELRYAFWPLFKGQVIIPEITLVKPEILIEKSRRGDFNFSDMFSQSAERKPQTVSPHATEKRTPINLIVNTFALSKGKISYIDYAAGSENQLKNINFKISGITLSMLKPIMVRASAVGTYQGKDIPISLSGGIQVDPVKEIVKLTDFSFSLAGETLNLAATAKSGPEIEASLSTSKLSLDPFLAIFSGAPSKAPKEKAVTGALTQTLKQAASAIPQTLTLKGSVDFKNITLSHLKISALKLNLGLLKRVASIDIPEVAGYNGKLSAKGVINLPALSYNFGKLEIRGFTAAPFINDAIDSFLPNLLDLKNKVEGKLDVALSVKGSGVEMPEVFNNLEASGIILLADGKLGKLKSLSSIGEKYNLSILKQDMLVKGLRIEASLARKKLEVKKLTLQDTDLQVAFNGGLDFNKMEYVKGNVLNLKFSPDATRDLPRELSVFRDEKGFASMDFELQGSLAKPFPSPILTKPLEAVAGKIKAKIEAKKIEIETKAQQELKKSEEEAKKKLEEEAKKKVKEILKF